MPPRRRNAARRTPRRRIMRRRPARRSAASTNAVGARLRANAFGSTRALSGFPQRMLVCLPYVTMNRLNANPLTQLDQTFNLNSAYDPDYSGGGHQPRGYDEWASIYARYRVHKVQAYILMRQRASHGLIGRVVLSNSASTMQATGNLGEYNNSTYIGITSANQPALRKRLTIYPNKVLGMTRAVYNANEDVAAAIGSDPAEACYLHLIGTQVDGATVADFEFEITLYYTVEFFDRINLPQS